MPLPRTTRRGWLLRSAGDAFSADNDLGDLLHNPPKSHDSPEARFFEKRRPDFTKVQSCILRSLAMSSPVTASTLEPTSAAGLKLENVLYESVTASRT